MNLMALFMNLVIDLTISVNVIVLVHLVTDVMYTFFIRTSKFLEASKLLHFEKIG